MQDLYATRVNADNIEYIVFFYNNVTRPSLYSNEAIFFNGGTPVNQ